MNQERLEQLSIPGYSGELALDLVRTLPINPTESILKSYIGGSLI